MPRRVHRRLALAALATGAGLPWTVAQAQTATWSGTVALSSQLVDRGLAITPDTAVLQAAGSVSLPSGWVFGASASGEVRDLSPLSEAFVQASLVVAKARGHAMPREIPHPPFAMRIRRDGDA